MFKDWFSPRNWTHPYQFHYKSWCCDLDTNAICSSHQKFDILPYELSFVHTRRQGYSLKTNSPLRPQRRFSDHLNDTMSPSFLLTVCEVLILVFYLNYFFSLEKTGHPKSGGAFGLRESREDKRYTHGQSGKGIKSSETGNGRKLKLLEIYRSIWVMLPVRWRIL